VRPNRQRQVEHRILAWREASRGEAEEELGRIVGDVGVEVQRLSGQGLFSFGNTPSPTPSLTPAETRDQTALTPPRKAISESKSTPPRSTVSKTTPQNAPSRSTPRLKSTPSRRTPSVDSAASSSRTHATPTHRTPSGGSSTAQGVNVRAVPTRRMASGAGGAAYTKQGVRVGSSGYVGKWKDPKKGGEKEEVGVWKGHPALQPRPGGGCGGGGKN
jgi:hypothetical protein